MFKMKRKLLSLFMALIMLLSMVPATVFGASDDVPFTAMADGTEINVELSEEEYTHINWDNTTGATVRLYIASVPADAEEVELDFGDENVLVYGYMADGTYIAAYDEYEDILVGSSTATVTAENFDYFAEVQTPYDANWVNELLYAVAFEVEEEGVPFTAEADGEELEAVLSDETYTHINWDGTEGATVDLYVVTVPSDAEEVELDFGDENVLVYGYMADGTYIAAYDEYEDIMVGSSSAAVTEENFGYYAEVQTPYDANWVNELLYAVAFEVEEEGVPFTAEADGENVGAEVSEEDYVPVDWDGTEGESVKLYTVEVPEDTETIVFEFDEEVLAYGYDSSHNYVASYGESDDYWMVGDVTATVTAENFAEYVRVQTPYYDGMNSELLYAIHILKETATPESPTEEVSADNLLENISASYTEMTSAWEVMEMGAYEDMVPSGSKLTDEAKQEYISKAIDNIISDESEDSDIAKEIIALTAIGVDAEELYPLDSEEAVSAIEILNSVTKSTSGWKAPYVLAAYNQNDYEDTENYEQALIDGLLDNQKSDGRWEEYESPAQTTAAVIAGLSFYKDNEDVSEAIEKGIEYLSSVQNDDGTFGSERNSNATAVVIVGLAACGINPDTDERFVNGETSALDALLSYALEDNSGFGYTNNTVLNAYATEQSFRALIAAKQIISTGEAFNIYDFSHNTALEAGYAEKIEDDTPSEAPDTDGKKITVKMSIKAGSGYWMRGKEVALAKKATVYDALIKALEDTDITQRGAKDGYVKYMIKDGEKYGEFTEGKNSGWIYKVNNNKPEIGLKDYKLEDGDDILWYFTEDYTTDPVVKDGMSVAVANYLAAIAVDRIIEEIGEVTLDSFEAIKAAIKAYDTLTDEQQVYVKKYHILLAAKERYAELCAELEKKMNPELEKIYSDISEDDYYYKAAQWAVANEIASGITETQFGGEEICTRGEIVTFLWKVIGSPEAEMTKNVFKDMTEKDYYYDAVMWAREYNITSGIEADFFGADYGVTRAQAITFLWRMAGKPKAEKITAFSDVPVDAYYYDAVMWAAENSITSGTFADMFSPDSPCLRGQILAFLYRCFGE